MASESFYTKMAEQLASAAPMLPMSLHLMVSALIPIYTGAHASLSRPPSAASPPARRRSTSSSDDDDDEDEPVVKMEGLSPSDAILFPLIAGCTLAGLYVVIKYVGPQLLNKVLGIYFSGMGVFSLGRMLADMVRVVEGYVWPAVYRDQGRGWRVHQGEKRVVEVDGKSERRQPLPGWWGRMQLSPAMVEWAWSLRGLLGKRYEVQLRWKGKSAVKARLTLRALSSGLVAAAVVGYATFVHTPWYLTNLQGFAFSYTALQLMSPTTFGTGTLILVALFFYDIYFVFYTPLMVSVATNLDVPIKLLFPRPEIEAGKPALAMLGLGDVVLPGIMVGLCLRFDLYLHYLRKQTKRVSTGDDSTQDDELVKAPYVSVSTKWGERFWTRGWSEKAHVPGKDDTVTGINKLLPRFRKTYFKAAVVGYIVGMSTTLIVMHVFQHAQPALLYLVPGVLSAVWLTAAAKGEVNEMWAYTEVVEDELDEKEKNEADKSTETKQSLWYGDFFGTSFLGKQRMDRNEERVKQSLAKNVQVGKEIDEGSDDGNDETSGKAKPVKHGMMFSLSIKAVASKQKRSDQPETEERSKSRSASGSGSDDAVLVSRDEVQDSIQPATATATGVEARKGNRSRKA